MSSKESGICPHGRSHSCDECLRESIISKHQTGSEEELAKYFCPHGKQKNECRECYAKKEQARQKETEDIRDKFITDIETLIEEANISFNRYGKICLHGNYGRDCENCQQQIETLKEEYLKQVDELDKKLKMDYWGSLKYQDVETVTDSQSEYRNLLEEISESAMKKIREAQSQYLED